MIDVRPTLRSNEFRAARIRSLKALVQASIDRSGGCDILDIGGTPQFWSNWRAEFDWSRTRLTCLNLWFDSPGDEWMRLVEGDARNLSTFGNCAFDVVFSNSVIQHVGNWHDMAAMAREVRRVGKSYFVQTPYFWFPIEPHTRTPLLHWLPESLAYRIVLARNTPFRRHSADVDGAMRLVQSARLVDSRQFKTLFPDAEIRRERLFGLTKSLIAVRNHLAPKETGTGAQEQTSP